MRQAKGRQEGGTRGIIGTQGQEIVLLSRPAMSDRDGFVESAPLWQSRRAASSTGWHPRVARTSASLNDAPLLACDASSIAGGEATRTARNSGCATVATA